MRFIVLSARLDKESVKNRKESERAKMSKRQKHTSILSYFAKQRRKESTEKNMKKQILLGQPVALTLLSQLGLSLQKNV